MSEPDPSRPSGAGPGGRLHVVHLLRTANFAGVERYVSYLAPVQVEQGLEVTVIGGDARRMQSAFEGTGVNHRPSGGFAHDLRVLTHARPDLVHAHMTDAEVASVLTKAHHQAPVVATMHFARPRGRNRLLRRLWALLPARLDAQIAISAFVAEASGEVDATVILNGVPWDQPEVEREPVVLVAQRLEPEKNTATALRAWAASGLGDRGWRLVVAGEGKERAALDALAHELEIGSSVEFVGTVDDMPIRLARAGAFLATATAEPFGLSVVEAMAAGTPVVATATGGHRETAGRVSSDRLFAPGDADAAATILIELAGDPAKRAAYGEALRHHYRAELTIEHHAARVHEVYRGLTGPARPGPPRLP